MYVDGTVREDIPLADISEVIPTTDNQVWLDIEAESPERISATGAPSVASSASDRMRLLKEEFNFHDLALEDCVKAGQRAKIDEYPGYYFLVFYSPYWDTKRHRVRARELHCFVGTNYLVTVHHEPLPALATALQRWKQNPAMMAQGIGYLVYTIMDSVIDEYFPLLEKLGQSIEVLEDRILQEQGNHSAHNIFRLKRDLLYLRKILAPKRDIFSILARRDQPFFTPQTQPYLRDVYDHLLRILEQVDTQREMTSGLLDAHLTATSNRLNAVMKTLTVVATVLMTLGLIAGIYGMNFTHMPELHWTYGYPAALGLMGASGVVMAWFFRRKHWF